MKTLRILLAIATPCLVTFCASIEQRVLDDGKQIINAAIAKGEKKAGL